jgi:two-component system chemotaxis response regulator CheB
MVQHRRADEESRLVMLLQRYTSLTVVEPEDKDPLQKDHVYVAPAGYHLLVERDSLSLSLDAPVIFARPSIDVLFESVADSFGERAVAVMLTGSNEDGAAGAVAVKRAGGRVYVQNPKTAESPAAPRAVLAVVQPDAVLDLPALAGLLAGLVAREPEGGERALEKTPAILPVATEAVSRPPGAPATRGNGIPRARK